MTTQIALQLWTLRDFLKTPAEIATTLARVKKIGYDAVQLSGQGPIDAKELSRILDSEGLLCCATHVSLEELRDQTSKVIDDHRLWKSKYTAIGGFGWNNMSAKDWIKFAADYSAIAAKFSESGIAIGYHNHSHELMRFEGKTALEILVEKLNPSVWMEIDTYWIQHGGGDPIAWIDKVGGRIPCVHFKDMAMVENRTQVMAEVGEGNLNWPGIVGACKRAGVIWYIIEQDTCQRDPFESIAISLRNVRAMGLA